MRIIEFPNLDATHLLNRAERAERLRPAVAHVVDVLGATEVASRTGLSKSAVVGFAKGTSIPLRGSLDAYQSMLAAVSLDSIAEMTGPGVPPSAVPGHGVRAGRSFLVSGG